MAKRKKRSGARGHPRALHIRHFARLDRERPLRVGVPEVILGEGKSVGHLMEIVDALSQRGLGALISRPTEPQLRALKRWSPSRRPGTKLTFLAEDRLVRLSGPIGPRYRNGVVALLTAGTSDVAIAEEARAVLRALGIQVVRAYDVGVAGLHRLLSAIHRMEAKRPEIYLVFAGREGALPTVVAGLVPAPVVGVPTSTGYGRGGRGEAALNAMLQSCAPLAVVNIDAGVPAALFAAQRFAEPSRRRRSGPPRG